jgi:hypothetical protein
MADKRVFKCRLTGLQEDLGSPAEERYGTWEGGMGDPRVEITIRDSQIADKRVGDVYIVTIEKSQEETHTARTLRAIEDNEKVLSEKRQRDDPATETRNGFAGVGDKPDWVRSGRHG